MLRLKAIALAALLLASTSAAALAQTTSLDQIPAPVPSTSNTGLNSENLLQFFSVPGGAVYQSFFRQPGAGGQLVPGGMAFVPGGGGAITRYLPLIDGHSDAGVPMTATAGTPTGTVGVKRTAGTSLTLDTETASSGAVTDKVIFEFNLASTYIAGANIPVIVNANYTGAGTITAASTTITAQLYSETNGVEAAITTSAAQQFTGTATNYTFTVTGTGLVPGQHVMLELVVLVTNSASTNVGHVNSVAYQG